MFVWQLTANDYYLTDSKRKALPIQYILYVRLNLIFVQYWNRRFDELFWSQCTTKESCINEHTANPFFKCIFLRPPHPPACASRLHDCTSPFLLAFQRSLTACPPSFYYSAEASNISWYPWLLNVAQWMSTDCEDANAKG